MNIHKCTANLKGLVPSFHLSLVKQQLYGQSSEVFTELNLFHLKVSCFYSKITSFLPNG